MECDVQRFSLVFAACRNTRGHLYCRVHAQDQDPSDVQDPEEDENGPMVVVERAFPTTNSSLGYPAWEGAD